MFSRLFFWTLVLATSHCAIFLEDDIFPLNLKNCKRSENNYSTCFINAIQESWPTFVKGVAAFESPPFDPLEIGKIEHHLKIGQLNSDIFLKNIKVYGLANTKFLKADPRFTNDSIELDLYVEIPKMSINGNYKANGVYNFFFNVRGVGPFNISMEHVTAKWSLEGNIENDRWIIEHFQNDLEVKGMKVHFNDLFRGNRRLNNAAQLVMNQRWPLFFRNLKPAMTEVSNALVANILNRDIFSKVSASKIFPL